LGITGISSCVQCGAAPSPMKPTPISSATDFTSRRCSFTSSQVSWIVLSGAPDSSSCPPGSSETLAPSCVRPMMLSPSNTGVQP
jgi:hypothetical protein